MAACNIPIDRYFPYRKLTNVSGNPAPFKALLRILTDKEKRFHSKTHIKTNIRNDTKLKECCKMSMEKCTK